MNIVLSYYDDMIEGMINIYGEEIKKRYVYGSDSNGIERHTPIRELADNQENEFLHLLTHLVWWTDAEMAPRPKAERASKGRGRSPLNWSLIENKKPFIMHMFLMGYGADDGHVFDAETFDINEFDRIKTLYFKNSISVKKMMARSLPNLLNGQIELIAQQSESSYYPKRSHEDGEIFWEQQDLFQIYNLVRAVTYPYSGAFEKLSDGRNIKIWNAQPFDTRLDYTDAGYGEIVEEIDRYLIIKCRSGLL